MREFDWTQSEFFVTSVSSPYFKNQKATIPNYKDFIKVAEEYVDSIDVAIIGRDPNFIRILQQNRVRNNTQSKSY